jgi:hypothetical protein
MCWWPTLVRNLESVEQLGHLSRHAQDESVAVTVCRRPEPPGDEGAGSTSAPARGMLASEPARTLPAAARDLLVADARGGTEELRHAVRVPGRVCSTGRGYAAGRWRGQRATVGALRQSAAGTVSLFALPRMAKHFEIRRLSRQGSPAQMPCPVRMNIAGRGPLRSAHGRGILKNGSSVRSAHPFGL